MLTSLIPDEIAGRPIFITWFYEIKAVGGLWPVN